MQAANAMVDMEVTSLFCQAVGVNTRLNKVYANFRCGYIVSSPRTARQTLVRTRNDIDRRTHAPNKGRCVGMSRRHISCWTTSRVGSNKEDVVVRAILRGLTTTPCWILMQARQTGNILGVRRA